MTVGVRGVELAVDDRGRGLPVLWGHGLTSSMAAEEQLGLLTPALDEDRFRLVRYDARGHGGSGATADPAHYAYAELARDQLALADALGIDRFVTGGVSLGSGTALHVAVQAPERVAAVVLVIPPTGWEGRAGRGGWYREAGRLAREEGVEAVIAMAESEPLPPVFEPFADLMEGAVRQRYGAYDPEVLAALLEGVGGSDLPPREAVAGIGVPVLVLAWSGDPVHPEATAEALGEMIAGAEVRIAPDLGEVGGWRRRMAAFLDEVLASRPTDH